MNATAGIILAAAARIKRDGLNKGGYYAGYGDGGEDTGQDRDMILELGATPAVDIFGALHLETQDDLAGSRAIRTICETAIDEGVVEVDKNHPLLSFIAPQLLVQWSDSEDTTAEQVVSLLEKAAEVAA